MRTMMALLCVVVAACGGAPSRAALTTEEPDAAVTLPPCDELADACETSLSELGAQCHALGHEGTDDECRARRTECLLECGEDGSSGHHHRDGGA